MLQFGKIWKHRVFPKHRVFSRNIVYFWEPTFLQVLGSRGNYDYILFSVIIYHIFITCIRLNLHSPELQTWNRLISGHPAISCLLSSHGLLFPRVSVSLRFWSLLHSSPLIPSNPQPASALTRSRFRSSWTYQFQRQWQKKTTNSRQHLLCCFTIKPHWRYARYVHRVFTLPEGKP